MQEQDTKLIAHLLRRAGFGATQDELAAYAAQGYDATVEELLEPTDPRSLPSAHPFYEASTANTEVHTPSYIQSTFNQVLSFLIEGDRRYSFQTPHLSTRPAFVVHYLSALYKR